ncbi:MAG: response regulator transcription factor [Ignavibacteriales bacterium]|nr:response regulator transcription factor [Ignavibacteriales bacterium]
MNKIKVLLIEDNRLLREGILQILKQHSDIEVLESANETKTTFSLMHEMSPDVILMDLGLRNQNSLRVVEILHEEFP